MTDVKRIESYGLYDFCQDIEAAFKEGYVFDFDTNENFPTAYGTMLTCGLIKASAAEVAAAAAVEVEPEGLEQTSELAPEGSTAEVEDETKVEEVPTEETPAKRSEDPSQVKRGPKAKNK